MKHSNEPQTILVVEDDLSLLTLLEEVLKNAGYRVLMAQNSSDALLLALQNAPDLALLDIQMPGISGLMLAQSLVDETSVPFAFLTKETGAEELQKATALGAIGFLAKPIYPAQIIPFITISLARAKDMQYLTAREMQLQTAVEASRTIGAAVGLLMAKHPINESQAFKRLHDYSRSHRQKIIDTAKALVTSQENINLM